MDSEETFDQLELVLATLRKARKQLRKLDGMEQYIEQLASIAQAIELEVADLLTLEE
jgi:hypothetical protein